MFVLNLLPKCWKGQVGSNLQEKELKAQHNHGVVAEQYFRKHLLKYISLSKLTYAAAYASNLSKWPIRDSALVIRQLVHLKKRISLTTVPWPF